MHSIFYQSTTFRNISQAAAQVQTATKKQVVDDLVVTTGVPLNNSLMELGTWGEWAGALVALFALIALFCQMKAQKKQMRKLVKDQAKLVKDQAQEFQEKMNHLDKSVEAQKDSAQALRDNHEELKEQHQTNKRICVIEAHHRQLTFINDYRKEVSDEVGVIKDILADAEERRQCGDIPNIETDEYPEYKDKYLFFRGSAPSGASAHIFAVTELHKFLETKRKELNTEYTILVNRGLTIEKNITILLEKIVEPLPD